jgi:hypothetical protein
MLKLVEVRTGAAQRGATRRPVAFSRHADLGDVDLTGLTPPEGSGLQPCVDPGFDVGDDLVPVDVGERVVVTPLVEFEGLVR